jgi:hypothetical protein
LVRVPSRLIATLNWDLAIEQTADRLQLKRESIVLRPEAVEDAIAAVTETEPETVSISSRPNQGHLGFGGNS